MISIGFNSFTNIRVFIDDCDQEDKNNFCDLEGDVYGCCNVNTTTPIKVPGVGCLSTFLNLYKKIPVSTVSNLSDFGHETPVLDFILVPVPRLCMLSPIPILNKTVHVEVELNYGQFGFQNTTHYISIPVPRHKISVFWFLDML